MSNMVKTKYDNKGLTGLANLGNTCFINATLQCLSHTYELNEFLNTNFTDRLNKNESLILTEWNELRNLMWSENCTISPNKFLNSIHLMAQKKDRDIFTGFAQNDLPEFLLFIMDCFHSALEREVDMEIRGTAENTKDNLAIKCYKMMKNMYCKEYSEILDMFYGIHVSKVEYHKTKKNLNITPEPFFLINLPIPDISSPTLMSCFELYTSVEHLDKENGLINEKTKQKEAINKDLKFFKLPNILVIDLKRFTNSIMKNQKLVDIPLTDLNLSKYVVGYNKFSYVYDLYGVCNHSGSTMGGHYTSHIKNSNGKWYLFNDRLVNEITEKQVITNQAYCLFYRKKK